MKKKIYFSDLTHIAQGVSAPTFPLGISFVASYAKQKLGDEFDFKLFKFPLELNAALQEEFPLVLCFSNYCWNHQLAYKVSSLVKLRNPNVVIIFGGPNFPTDDEERLKFLQERPAIDFYIELEGEIGFVEVIQRLMEYNFAVNKLKEQRKAVLNTSYICNGHLIKGPQERIKNLNIIPSPYLTGILDSFFSHSLIPMIQTTRGCPFSCSFCSDALNIKNKVLRFDFERTKEELCYIAKKVKNVDELIITDLNFAMYEEDIRLAKSISEIQKNHNFPIILSASPGKNRPETVMEVAGILNGTWMLGASMQSIDTEVLKAIKRTNISINSFKKIIEYGNTLENGKTHTEFILGLPNDTKEKHFKCLRFAIDNNANSIRMFQAILLIGTEMANKDTRKNYNLTTKFRTIPGCVGIYEFLGGKHSIAEIEEIIVGGKEFSFEDYIECRIMDLIVETFHNNAIFFEVFAMLRTLRISAFDCLLYIKDHTELYSSKVREIMNDFIKQTIGVLFDSFEGAREYILKPEIVKKYLRGELGINELLVNRSRLFIEFDDISNLLFDATKGTLKESKKLTQKIVDYLDELKKFIILRKKGCLMDVEMSFKGTFHYDFDAIHKLNYEINPNNFPVLDYPVKFKFFHTDKQKQHISNQSKVYINTPIGLGRLIQRSNLKNFYRHFTFMDDTKTIGKC